MGIANYFSKKSRSQTGKVTEEIFREKIKNGLSFIVKKF
jgi:hypothetical protein